MSRRHQRSGRTITEKPSHRPVTGRRTPPIPILMIGLYSDVLPVDQSTIMRHRRRKQITQLPGIGRVYMFGEQKPAVPFRSIRMRLQARVSRWRTSARSRTDQRQHTKGNFSGTHRHQYRHERSNPEAEDYRRVSWWLSHGAPVHIEDIGNVIDGVENMQVALGGQSSRHRAGYFPAFPAPMPSSRQPCEGRAAAATGPQSRVGQDRHPGDRTEMIRAPSATSKRRWC